MPLETPELGWEEGDIITFRAWFRNPGGCGSHYPGTLAIWTLSPPVDHNSTTDFSITGCTGWNQVTVKQRVTESHDTIRAEIYGRVSGGTNLDIDGTSLTVNRVL